MSSIRMQSGRLDVADHVHDLADAGALAALVDDGEVGVDALWRRRGRTTPPTSGDTTVRLRLVSVSLMSLNTGSAKDCRDVEEALDLGGMQVEGQHRSTPGIGERLATSLAEIGVRGPVRRSLPA